VKRGSLKALDRAVGISLFEEIKRHASQTGTRRLACGSHSKKNKPPRGAPNSRASHTGSVSTEEEPKKPSHVGWIVTQGDRPALDEHGRFQVFGSPIQARQAAQYQGRETRYCTITVQPGEQPLRGTPVANMNRSVFEKSAARQKSKGATAPRVTKPADPERERKRAMEAASRLHRKRP
jgi:hypothetical protein